MKLLPISTYNYSTQHKNRNAKTHKSFALQQPIQNHLQTTTNPISFGFDPIKKLKEYHQYKKAQNHSDKIFEYAKQEGLENFFLRQYKLEPLEGLQYGIKVFEGLSMKDIQYLAEGLHVIAVKRGCTNKCSHCYADALPQKREMSWEDFTTITKSIKKIRERLHYLPIYGENMPHIKDDILFDTIELFYDADCLDLEIKDKKGKIYDFADLATEINNSLGKKTAFDTAGWQKTNTRMQKRAEKYAQYFAKQENMAKLNQFNISFNVFNATYVASRKALKEGDYEKAKRLRTKFVENTANMIFTFTPLIASPKFNILQRCFDGKAKNAVGFNLEAMERLIRDVYQKVVEMYVNDLNGEQKYIKTVKELERKKQILKQKMSSMDTRLNSSGRMLKFMDEFKIKAQMQDHTESTKLMIEDLKKNGRHHKYLVHKLIDTDGKVYHMDYARFIPTEIQLNIENKATSPKLANTVEEFTITKDLLNK